MVEELRAPKNVIIFSSVSVKRVRQDRCSLPWNYICYDSERNWILLDTWIPGGMHLTVGFEEGG